MLKVTDKDIWINPTYKSNLDSLIHNIKNDWETILVFTGDGLLRVGKTMLATQTGYYMAYCLGTPFTDYNIVFSGKELMERAIKAPKNSVFVYDESLNEMSSKRVMETVSKNLMEFFSECGLYNHVIVLVLPDFFDLNKSIALNRSECLINVVRGKKIVNDNGSEVVEWERGLFEFYSRNKKKYLYLNGIKTRSYTINGKRCYDFWGNFRNNWVIDKDKYEERKREFIRRDRAKLEKPIPKLLLEKRNRMIVGLSKNFTQKQIAEMLDMEQARVSQILNEV